MEEIIAEWERSTDNKMVWSVDVGGVRFSFYIPKWRIPEPTPEEILIKIYFLSEEVPNKQFISRADIQLHPELKTNNIYADIHKFSEQTQTIRFKPNGAPNTWEIGEPYIPNSILRNHDYDELTIVIEWVVHIYKDNSSLKIGKGVLNQKLISRVLDYKEDVYLFKSQIKLHNKKLII